MATIKVGETVTWSFAGTTIPHNVKATDNWVLPNAPAPKVGNDPRHVHLHDAGHLRVLLHAARADDARHGHGRRRGRDASAASAAPAAERAAVRRTTSPAPTILEVRDTIVPTLDRVAVTRVRKGARVRFRLSEAGKVTIKLTRRGQRRQDPHRPGAQGHVVGHDQRPARRVLPRAGQRQRSRRQRGARRQARPRHRPLLAATGPASPPSALLEGEAEENGPVSRVGLRGRGGQGERQRLGVLARDEHVVVLDHLAERDRRRLAGDRGGPGRDRVRLVVALPMA